MTPANAWSGRIRVASLRQSFGFLLVANGVSAASQFAIIAALVHLGSQSILGSFVFVMSVWAPAVLMATLRLRSVITGDQSGAFQFSEYLGLQLTTLAVVFPLVLVIARILSADPHLLLVFLLIGLSKAVEAIVELAYGLFQKHGLFEIIAVSKIARAVASLLGLFVGMVVTSDLAWACFGFLLGSVLVALAVDLPRTRIVIREFAEADSADRAFPEFPRDRLWKLLRTTIPLGVTAVAISLTVNTPKYFVKSYLGDADLGFFGAMVYIITGGTLVINAVCNSFLPQLASSYKAGQLERFRALVLKFLGINGVLGILGVLFALVAGTFLFTSILGFNEVDVFPSFVIVMASGAIVFLAHALQFILMATDRFSNQVLPVVLDFAVTTVACLVLVPGFGVEGAAIAIVLGSLTRLIGFSVPVLRLYSATHNSGAVLSGEED